MTSPADTLRRRLRELVLMLELNRAPAVSRDAMLMHLRTMLEEYDALCADMHRAETLEREQAEASWDGRPV